MTAFTRVRVRYAETDQMGVVYYANYFVWFEIGRTELLRTLGGSYRELEASGVFLPVIDTACRYLQSSRYDDELEIRTEGQLISAIRVRFDYTVTRLADQVTTAQGYTVHAALSPRGRACRLPDHIRTALA